MPEQISEFSMTLTPALGHASYPSVTPKRMTVTAVPPQQQSGDMATPKRCLYDMPLGMPITHLLPPKWTENEEVLCCFRGEMKAPFTIKPKKPS